MKNVPPKIERCVLTKFLLVTQVYDSEWQCSSTAPALNNIFVKLLDGFQ